MTIIEAMEQRRSVRTFDGRGLTPDTVTQLRNIIDASSSPFGGNVSIGLNKYAVSGKLSPTTYGMIRDAEWYFLVATGDDEDSSLSAGFRFEQVVLRAWQLGLGTCWLGGTFSKSDFDKDRTWPEDESLRIVCPVGTAAGESLMGRVARFVAGSKNRKPFDSLFFNGGFGTPLDPADRFGTSLAMMRLAPSSTNSQPWRAVVSGGSVHFYYKARSGFSVLDTGIGICHFSEAEKHYGHRGFFSKSDPGITTPKGVRYLVSYTRGQ